MSLECIECVVYDRICYFIYVRTRYVCSLRWLEPRAARAPHLKNSDRVRTFVCWSHAYVCHASARFQVLHFEDGPGMRACSFSCLFAALSSRRLRLRGIKVFA